MVLPLLAGELRPAMVEAVRRCSERLVTACLTNNWVSFHADGTMVLYPMESVSRQLERERGRFAGRTREPQPSARPAPPELILRRGPIRR